MKYLIASDIHGSAFYCEQLLEQFREQGADKLILLGDILYHGPRNELPFGYEPKRVIEMLNEVSDKIFCVRGNCDSEVDQAVLRFPIMAEYAIMPYKNKTVFITHGHKYGIEVFDRYYLAMKEYNEAKERGEAAVMPDPVPALNPGDVLLQGHTHVSGYQMMKCGAINVNPGSVSIPKSGSSHSYLTFEDGLFTRYNIDGEPGMKYDINETEPADVNIEEEDGQTDAAESETADEESAE